MRLDATRQMFRAGGLAIGLATTAAAQGAFAQDAAPVPGISLYGASGMVEMPSGLAQPDGMLTLSANLRDGVYRGTLNFQITPRLSGTFRYSYLNELFGGRSLYDRSFDLRYRLLNEGAWMPAVTIGLQDFGGTGIYGSEYVAATKTLSPRITVTGGIGWGRLGSHNGFSNPLGFLSDGFDTRPAPNGVADSGKIGIDRFFRGDAALFAGLTYQASDRLRFAVEYSSDAQATEVRNMDFDYASPINVAGYYKLRNGSELGLAVLHGTTATLQYNFSLNPAKPRNPSGIEAGPPSVVPRDMVVAGSWDLTKPTRVAAALKAQGLRLEGIEINGNTATVDVSNNVWGAGPQAIGRAARVLTGQLPPEVTVLRIRPTAQGMTLSEVVIQRADLEQLEYAPDGSWQSYVRAQIGDASGHITPFSGLEPAFTSKLRPFFSPSVFDPDNPVRADIGAQASFEWRTKPGVILSGAARKVVAGNRDTVTRVSNSVLPHVRSDGGIYDQQADPSISYLTAEYFFRPGPNLYGRVTAGYLERMYGGVSSEILWKPVESRLALGVEVNYAKQRDFDGLFGFQNYDIVTGHASAYYDFGKGYLGQIDVGRYLAGDLGTTISLDREFGNGFKVGAFFTLTDVSFDDFGEGAFDKGIRLSIPGSWLVGEATSREFSTTIRPVLRDGGARLNVRNRLHDVVRDFHEPELGERWGRFWR